MILGITLASVTRTSNRLSGSLSLWVNHKVNDGGDDNDETINVGETIH